MVHIHLDTVEVWKVPPKAAIVGGNEAVVIPALDSLEPDFVLPLPQEIPARSICRAVAPSPWLQNQLDQMSFDLFTISTGSPHVQFNMSRYRLDVCSSQEDTKLSRQFKISLPSVHFTYIAIQRMKYSTELEPGTMLALTTKDHSTSYAYIEPTSSTPDKAVPEEGSTLPRVTAIQEKDEEIGVFEVYDTVLCGASGRSFYMSAMREGVAYRVVDYHSFRSSNNLD